MRIFFLALALLLSPAVRALEALNEDGLGQAGIAGDVVPGAAPADVVTVDVPAGTEVNQARLDATLQDDMKRQNPLYSFKMPGGGVGLPRRGEIPKLPPLPQP